MLFSLHPENNVGLAAISTATCKEILFHLVALLILSRLSEVLLVSQSVQLFISIHN